MLPSLPLELLRKIGNEVGEDLQDFSGSAVLNK